MFRALAQMDIDHATRVVSEMIKRDTPFDEEDPSDIVKYLDACENDGDCEEDMAMMFEHLSNEQRVAVLGALLDCDSNAEHLLTAIMENGSDGEEIVAEAIQGFGTDEMCTLLKSLSQNQRIQLYEQMRPKKVAKVLSAGVENESTRVESTHVNKKPRHW